MLALLLSLIFSVTAFSAVYMEDIQDAQNLCPPEDGGVKSIRFNRDQTKVDAVMCGSGVVRLVEYSDDVVIRGRVQIPEAARQKTFGCGTGPCEYAPPPIWHRQKYKSVPHVGKMLPPKKMEPPIDPGCQGDCGGSPSPSASHPVGPSAEPVGSGEAAHGPVSGVSQNN